MKMTPDSRVLVAGSTHEGEEAIVLKVYRELLQEWPELRLIVVPRHPERGKAVSDLVRGQGLTPVLLSEIIAGGQSDRGVVVVDVIGELFGLYSLATTVYCGGSLVAKGGQNILEPAAWGKVVFYGPSMEDFLDEKALLEEVGAGIPVGHENDALRSRRAQAPRNGRPEARHGEPRRRRALCGDDSQSIRQQAAGNREKRA